MAIPKKLLNAKNTCSAPTRALTAGYFEWSSHYLPIVRYQLDRTHPLLPLYRAGPGPCTDFFLSERLSILVRLLLTFLLHSSWCDELQLQVHLSSHLFSLSTFQSLIPP